LPKTALREDDLIFRLGLGLDVAPLGLERLVVLGKLLGCHALDRGDGSLDGGHDLLGRDALTLGHLDDLDPVALVVGLAGRVQVLDGAVVGGGEGLARVAVAGIAGTDLEKTILGETRLVNATQPLKC